LRRFYPDKGVGTSASVDERSNRRLAFVLLTHTILLAIGLFIGGWLVVAFCFVGPHHWLSSAMQLAWIGITLSPLLGVAALAFEWRWPRRIYYASVAAIPIFLVIYLGTPSDFFHCDGP